MDIKNMFGQIPEPARTPSKKLTLNEFDIPAIVDRLDIIGNVGCGISTVTGFALLKAMKCGGNILFLDTTGSKTYENLAYALSLRSGYDFYCYRHIKKDEYSTENSFKSVSGSNVLSFISLPNFSSTKEKEIAVKQAILHANSGQKTVFVIAGNTFFTDDEISCIMNPVVLIGPLNIHSRPSENCIILNNITTLPADIFPSPAIYKAYQRTLSSKIHSEHSVKAFIQGMPYDIPDVNFQGDIKTFSPHLL